MTDMANNGSNHRISDTHSHLKRGWRSESGVAAIELALILPVLFLVLFGIITFGTVFYNYIVITNAAREGARWGSIRTLPTAGPTVCGPTSALPSGTPANPCQVANAYTSNMLINYGGGTTTQTTATLVTTGTAPDTTSIITVTVTFNFEGIGFFKSMFSNGLKSTSKMYLEPQ